MHTDRQAEICAGRHAKYVKPGRDTCRQAASQADIFVCRQADLCAGRPAEIHSGRQAGIDKQECRDTCTHTGRQRYVQAGIHAGRQIYV